MKTLKNFFRCDFTQHREWLLNLAKGKVLAEVKVQLAEMLDVADPIAETRGQWSDLLEDAVVFYVGKNTHDFPTNPKYSDVVGIQIGDDERIYLNLRKG